MGRDEPTMEELRVELSNLRYDLTVIESSEIFTHQRVGNQRAVKAIRNRIAVIESILERNSK